MKAMVENWDLLMPALSYFDADPPPKEQMEIVMGCASGSRATSGAHSRCGMLPALLASLGPPFDACR